MLHRRALLAVLCLAAPAFPQARRRKPRLEPRPAEPPGPKPHYPHFTDAEIRAIREYYAPGSGNIPPGLAKGESLPPGLRQQLHRRATVPHAVLDKLEGFPGDLARRVLPPPKGYRHALTGGIALLIEEDSNLIVDTLDLAAR